VSKRSRPRHRRRRRRADDSTALYLRAHRAVKDEAQFDKFDRAFAPTQGSRALLTDVTKEIQLDGSRRSRARSDGTRRMRRARRWAGDERMETLKSA